MLGLAVLASGLLAACGGSTTSGSAVAVGGPKGVLTISNGSSGQFVANFNPFSPSALGPSEGYIYEPLYFSNTIKANSFAPWLATSYAWSNGGKSITFQLRHGVKWTDGQPFTSTDVAFTFDMEIKNQQLNTYSVPYTSVSTSGPYAVTLNFRQPSYEDFIYFGTKSYIVPEHLWKSVGTPATYTNTDPVGTGAYELSSVSGEAVTLTANPHYYLPGLPKIKKVQFLSYSGNTGADAAILAGQLDWASNFIPNIKQTYVAASSANHLVEVPVATTFLITNDQRGPTASLAVRKAISEAINSSLINQVVYDGEYLPANPEAMMLPNYEAYLSPALQNAKLSYDPSQAEQTLQAAGYKKGPDGIYVAPDGAPLSLTAQVVSGYTDYISILQILTEELKAAGIQLNTQIESTSAFAAAQDNGNFQLLMSSSGYTPSVYAYYYALLDSAVSAPIGQAAAGDYGRFHSAQLNSLLTQIAATQSTAAQLPLFYQVEQLVASQFPDIPILEGASGTEFNGKVISGFPTADNNYAGPDSWMEPDSGWVADRLSPVGS